MKSSTTDEETTVGAAESAQLEALKLEKEEAEFEAEAAKAEAKSQKSEATQAAQAAQKAQSTPAPEPGPEPAPEEVPNVGIERAAAARDRVTAIDGEVNTLTAQAEDKAAKIVQDAKAEPGSLENAVSSTEQELESVEGELSATESELGGAEERVAKGTITDGVWKIDRDYLAGTYEAPGEGAATGRCSAKWAAVGPKASSKTVASTSTRS